MVTHFATGSGTAAPATLLFVTANGVLPPPFLASGCVWCACVCMSVTCMYADVWVAYCKAGAGIRALPWPLPDLCLPSCLPADPDLSLPLQLWHSLRQQGEPISQPHQPPSHTSRTSRSGQRCHCWPAALPRQRCHSVCPLPPPPHHPTTFGPAAGLHWRAGQPDGHHERRHLRLP